MTVGYVTGTSSRPFTGHSQGVVIDGPQKVYHVDLVVGKATRDVLQAVIKVLHGRLFIVG